MDLFSVGLKHNAAAGVSLADSQKTLLLYRSNLDSLRPSERKIVDRLPGEWPLMTTGGVATIIGDSVRVFNLGSPSRGISHKEWNISLPVDDPESWCFCPGADAIAFFKVPESAWVDWSQERPKRAHYDVTVTLSSNSI